MLIKKYKKLIGLLCGISIIITGFLLWNNILILDDYHPDIANTVKAGADIAQNPDGTSGSSDDSEVLAAKKGYHIHINLDTLLMYVYKNGQLMKTFPVSGGKPSTPSPLGTWKIISKDTWGEGFGGAWLGFNVPWGKYGIHGTVYPWFIGKSNASKGCIRMNNKDVKELFKLVPHGTTVTVIHKNPSFRVIKSGSIGSDVIVVQKALKKLGYYKGGIDGKFGTGLRASLIKFQKDNKLYGNGVVNRKTYDLIMEKARALGNT